MTSTISRPEPEVIVKAPLVAETEPSMSVRPPPLPVSMVRADPFKTPALVRFTVSKPSPVAMSKVLTDVTEEVISTSSSSPPISTRNRPDAVTSPSRSMIALPYG